MRKLVFARNINGTGETGLIDLSKNPHQLFCLCDEDKAKEILNNMLDVLVPIKNVCPILKKIAKCIDDSIEIGLDKDQISEVVELMKDIADDNWTFVRN